MSPVHVQFPKMMVCMLQIINWIMFKCFIHIQGRGHHDRDGMVVGSTTIYDKVCQLLSLVAMSIVYTFATINCI
jgi:hypothetical protein